MWCVYLVAFGSCCFDGLVASSHQDLLGVPSTSSCPTCSCWFRGLARAWNTYRSSPTILHPQGSSRSYFGRYHSGPSKGDPRRLAKTVEGGLRRWIWGLKQVFLPSGCFFGDIELKHVCTILHWNACHLCVCILVEFYWLTFEENNMLTLHWDVRRCLISVYIHACMRPTWEDNEKQHIGWGEQGVDEGGLAREFFRLLSAHVFTVDGGLFDPIVAQNARVLWFNSASIRESTEFWLAGVILGLVVYNNMPGLDVRFPPVVFKKIKNEQLVLEDLRQVHPETYLSLRSLLSWEPEEELTVEELPGNF